MSTKRTAHNADTERDEWDVPHVQDPASDERAVMAAEINKRSVKPRPELPQAPSEAAPSAFLGIRRTIAGVIRRDAPRTDSARPALDPKSPKAQILKAFPSEVAAVKEGLRLFREACKATDELALSLLPDRERTLRRELRTADPSKLAELSQQIVTLRATVGAAKPARVHALRRKFLEVVAAPTESFIAAARKHLGSLKADGAKAEKEFFGRYGLAHEATAVSRRFDSLTREVDVLADCVERNRHSPASHMPHLGQIQTFFGGL